MEDEIHSSRGTSYGSVITDVAYVIFQFVTVIELSLIILLLLVAAEDANLPNVRINQSVQDGIAERARPPGYQ